VDQPLFSENVLSAWKDVEAIFVERGAEYTDTWRDCQWLALIAALRAVFGWCNPDAEALRTIAAAVFVDVKYSRLAGSVYKEDTAIDLAAYTPNFIAQMRKISERE
jgi:hypothetical protein